MRVPRTLCAPRVQAALAAQGPAHHLQTALVAAAATAGQP